MTLLTHCTDSFVRFFFLSLSLSLSLVTTTTHKCNSMPLYIVVQSFVFSVIYVYMHEYHFNSRISSSCRSNFNLEVLLKHTDVDVYGTYISKHFGRVYMRKTERLCWFEWIRGKKEKRTYRKSQGKIQVIFLSLQKREREWNVCIRIDLMWRNVLSVKNVWNAENLPVRDEHKLWRQ